MSTTKLSPETDIVLRDYVNETYEPLHTVKLEILNLREGFFVPEGNQDLLEYKNQSFELLGIINDSTSPDYDVEVLPMVKIKFLDGKETAAFLDEVFTPESLEVMYKSVEN